MVAQAIHEDWSRKPPIIVLDEWPENWDFNAVILTPLKVIGAAKNISFSIEKELSEGARKTLNAYINVSRTNAGVVTYRDVSTAAGMDRRTVTMYFKELEEAGIGRFKAKTGFHIDLGRWTPDAARAKALGIEIKEY